MGLDGGANKKDVNILVSKEVDKLELTYDNKPNDKVDHEVKNNPTVIKERRLFYNPEFNKIRSFSSMDYGGGMKTTKTTTGGMFQNFIFTTSK